jgi:hypothetical protein
MVMWWALGDEEKFHYYIERAMEKRMLPFYFLESPLVKDVKDKPWYRELKKKAGL